MRSELRSASRRGPADARPPEHVAREAAGLGALRRVHARRRAGTKESILQLPDIDDGYWYVQGRSIRQLIRDDRRFRPASGCSTSARTPAGPPTSSPRRGLQVIALDISHWEMQGLYTADYFIEDGTVVLRARARLDGRHADRLDSLDYVYCCEVLHHNDSDGLRRTFEEAFRVLKPGGRLLIVNETLKTRPRPSRRARRGGRAVRGLRARALGLAYRWEAIRAGFSDAADRAVLPLVLRRCRAAADGPQAAALTQAWRGARVLLELRLDDAWAAKRATWSWHQPRGRRHRVRDGRHASPTGAAFRASRTPQQAGCSEPGADSEVLGDVRRRAVEDHRSRARRSPSDDRRAARAAAQLAERLAGAGRRRG